MTEWFDGVDRQTLVLIRLLPDLDLDFGDSEYRRAGVICCASRNERYVCTLPAGHSGNHVATDVEPERTERVWP